MFMQTLKSYDERPHIPPESFLSYIKVGAVTTEMYIYEDDDSDAQMLKASIESFAASNQVSVRVTVYKHGRDLLRAIEAYEPDMLFLDVDAGENEPDGLEIAKQIHAWSTNLPIVFTTYLQEYAIFGYEVEALHYLIKPVTIEHIAVCFDRLEKERRNHPRKRLSISVVSDYKQLTIPVENITFAEVRRNTVTLHLSGRSISTNTSMSSLEQQTNGMLIRCHRSYLVNPRCIAGIDRNDFVLHSGERIPIRMNGHRKTIALYHDWLAKQTGDWDDAQV